MSNLLYDSIGTLGGGAVRANAAPPFLTYPGTGEPGIISRLGDIRVLSGLPANVGRLDVPGIPLGAKVARGSINAMVTMQGRPVARPVWALDQRGVLIAKTMSDENGNYRFDDLDTNQRYMVIALDVPEREYNAAISDYVQPE